MTTAIPNVSPAIIFHVFVWRAYSMDGVIWFNEIKVDLMMAVRWLTVLRCRLKYCY